MSKKEKDKPDFKDILNEQLSEIPSKKDIPGRYKLKGLWVICCVFGLISYFSLASLESANQIIEESKDQMPMVMNENGQPLMLSKSNQCYDISCWQNWNSQIKDDESRNQFIKDYLYQCLEYNPLQGRLTNYDKESDKWQNVYSPNCFALFSNYSKKKLGMTPEKLYLKSFQTLFDNDLLIEFNEATLKCSSNWSYFRKHWKDPLSKDQKSKAKNKSIGTPYNTKFICHGALFLKDFTDYDDPKKVDKKWFIFMGFLVDGELTSLNPKGFKFVKHDLSYYSEYNEFKRKLTEYQLIMDISKGE